MALGSERIELLPRPSSGKCGIGRRRRSVPPPNGLPGGGGGGQVTGPPGSEEPSGSTGSVTSTGHPVNRRASDSFRGTTGHQPKGPCRSYRRGPFTFSESRDRSARRSKPPAVVHSWQPSAVEIPAFSVDTTGHGCGRPAGTRSIRKKCRAGPCGTGLTGPRTSPTHSLRGERDRSEKTICTTAERLAGRRWRWPGDEAAGVGGTGWIDRECHRYRSNGGPPNHGLAPGNVGSPPEGPLSLIPAGALLHACTGP